MFKLSLALSAATLVAGQGAPADVAAFCTLLVAQCPVHLLNQSSCLSAFSNATTIPLGIINTANPAGDENSIACRQKYLDIPAFSVPAGVDKCRYAGPSGGGRCGQVVEGVCAVSASICSGIAGASYLDAGSCVTAYNTAQIQHQWGWNQGLNAASENSLECRVYHAIQGVASGVESHCSHWAANSAQCIMAVQPSISHYCETIMYNCNGSNTQYGSRAQCQGIADGLPNTQMDARSSNSNNTLGCREYHAQAAKAPNSAAHCAHGGPSGGAACGTYLQAWGSILAAKPCMDGHVQTFVNNVPSAIVDAAVPPGFTGAYHIALDTGMNTQACRIYHLGVAANSSGHCSHGWVSGDGNCGNSVRANLCKVIGAACGFGGATNNATWQYADEAACNTAMTPTVAQGNFSGGKGGDSTGNTYECRFYHATVAASYAPGGSAAAGLSAADAVVQRQNHCGHTLHNARAFCVGSAPAGSTAPTAAPAGKPSSAPEVSLLVAAAAVFVSVFSL